jgi:hypothetical protein
MGQKETRDALACDIRRNNHDGSFKKPLVDCLESGGGAWLIALLPSTELDAFQASRSTSFCVRNLLASKGLFESFS